MMNKKLLISFAVVLCGIFSLVLLMQYNKIKQNKEQIKYLGTRVYGDEIVIALLEYKMDNGLYPDTLKQLVPTYVQKIKSPIWGETEWDYFSEENGKDFVLLVRGSGESNQTYSTVFGYWYNGPQPTPVD